MSLGTKPCLNRNCSCRTEGNAEYCCAECALESDDDRRFPCSCDHPGCEPTLDELDTDYPESA